MYSAVYLNDSPSSIYGSFSRYGIFRKQIEINGHFVKTLFSPHWLWEPKFIGIEEDNNFVYIFFTEYSIENFVRLNRGHSNDELSKQLLSLNNSTFINGLKRVSRVARVCKKDSGVKSKKFENMWTTFRKVKLQCDCSRWWQLNKVGFLFFKL
jgi:hypothetical protein